MGDLEQKINSYTIKLADTDITILRIADYFAWHADHNGKRYGAYSVAETETLEHYKVMEQNATESMVCVLEGVKPKSFKQLDKLLEKYGK